LTAYPSNNRSQGAAQVISSPTAENLPKKHRNVKFFPRVTARDLLEMDPNYIVIERAVLEYMTRGTSATGPDHPETSPERWPMSMSARSSMHLICFNSATENGGSQYRLAVRPSWSLTSPPPRPSASTYIPPMLPAAFLLLLVQVL
jgi:hypothetical protein